MIRDPYEVVELTDSKLEFAQTYLPCPDEIDPDLDIDLSLLMHLDPTSIGCIIQRAIISDIKDTINRLDSSFKRLEGNYGHLYEGSDFFVKVSRIESKEYSRDNLLNEIMIGAFVNTLNDSGFIRTYGWALDINPDLPFHNAHDLLVLEKVSGRILGRRHLSDGKLIGNILFKIFTSLEHAHQTMDFTHYDLKNNNIMIDSTGQPKIIDFGLSHIRIKQHNFGSETMDGKFGVSKNRSYPAHDFFKLLSYLHDLAQGAVRLLFEMALTEVGLFELSKIMSTYPKRAFYALPYDDLSRFVGQEAAECVKAYNYSHFLDVITNVFLT